MGWVDAMIRALEQDKLRHPFELYIRDENIRAMGFDPELHDELRPGVRIVRGI
jgi:hypothetical protein